MSDLAKSLIVFYADACVHLLYQGRTEAAADAARKAWELVR